MPVPCRLLSGSGKAGRFVETASDSNDVAANVVFLPLVSTHAPAGSCRGSLPSFERIGEIRIENRPCRFRATL
jgi:hypothetical protein